MKNWIKTSVLAFLAALAFASAKAGPTTDGASVTATTPVPVPMPIVSEPIPDYLPIGSVAAIRTYALEQAGYITANVNSTVPLGNQSYSGAILEHATADGIEETFRSFRIGIDVVNPMDPLTVMAHVYNDNYDVLFYGSKSFNLIPVKGGYKLPPDHNKFKLEMVDEMPLRIPGASFAMLKTFGSDGTTSVSSTPISVNDGTIYFPTRLAGGNVLLMVYVRDASSMSEKPFGAWQYWTAEGRIQSDHFDSNINASIQGVHVVKDGDIFEVLSTTNRVGINQVVEYHSSRDQTVLANFLARDTVLTSGMIGPIPLTLISSCVGVMVRKSGTTEWTFHSEYSPLPGLFYTLDLGIGTYYVVPVWDDGDLIEVAPPEPIYIGTDAEKGQG